MWCSPYLPGIPPPPLLILSTKLGLTTCSSGTNQPCWSSRMMLSISLGANIRSQRRQTCPTFHYSKICFFLHLRDRWFLISHMSTRDPMPRLVLCTHLVRPVRFRSGIYHRLCSIGSTAFPKPIYWTNHRTIQGATIPWFGGRDLTNQVLSLHSMPMYHGNLFSEQMNLFSSASSLGMGILQTWWSVSEYISGVGVGVHFCQASCGLVLSAFEPKVIPTIPTPDSLFLAAKSTDSDIIFCVPSFIEVCFVLVRESSLSYRRHGLANQNMSDG